MMRNHSQATPAHLWWVLFLVLTNCHNASPDRSSPEKAYAYYQELLSKGDYEGIYGLLVKEVREQVDKSYANTKEAVRVVEKEYPLALKSQALQQIGTEELRNANSPAEFFVALILSTGKKPPRLSASERLALNVRKVQKTSTGTYEIQTVGGHRVEFAQGADGLFYLVPDKSDMAVIRVQLIRSIEILESIKQNVRSLGTDNP